MEFFLADDGIYFSELSPCLHDTGMMRLAGTQNLSEFELHARSMQSANASMASTVILADKAGVNPSFEGVEAAPEQPGSDRRMFGKPVTHRFRRMCVTLMSGEAGNDVESVRQHGHRECRKSQG